MRSLIVCLLLFAYSVGAFSQPPKIVIVGNDGREVSKDTSRWMPSSQIGYLKNILRVSYKKPDGFNEVPGMDCFKDNPMLEMIITCAGNQLHSVDKQFIAFIPVYKLLSKEDSTNLSQSVPGMSIVNTDLQHASQIRVAILTSLGKDAAVKGENANFDWRKYVTYYSSEEAKRKFNADTAIAFQIELDKDKYYQKKYRYLKALFIQKNGRGFLNFYCFFTDQAKRKLPKYWSAIEGALRYDD